MGLNDIWGLIWDNEPFHYATAIIFSIAVLIELGTTFLSEKHDRRELEPIIRYLNGKSHQLSERHKIWLENHLKRNQNGEFEKLGNRNLLQHYPALLSRSAPKSSLKFVPTILTAIGVLGTFYGIQYGLKDISPQMANSQELMSASQTLFSGMRTAFSTSLMGLGSSSLFTLILAGCEMYRQFRRNKIRKWFDSVAILETPEQIFSRFDFEANRQASDSLAKAAEQMARLDPNALGLVIGQSVGASLERVMSDRLTPVFQEINESLKSLRDIKQDQGQEVLENLIQSLRTEVLDPLVQRLDQSATLTTQASMAVQALHQDLGGISQSLASSVLTIQNFQKETLGDLQLFAQQLQGTLQEFRTDTKEVLNETAQGIKHGTIEILDRAQAEFEQQSRTLQTVGTEASSIMHTAKLHLIESLQKVDEMLQSSSQQVDSSMKSIKETAEAVSKLAMSDNLSWGARVHEIEEATRGIGKELQQSQKANREMQEAYQKALSSWQIHLDQSFGRFSETQSKFFDDADSSMATVCGKFLETVNVLVEVEKDRRNWGN
jgi:hypothetical protein